MDAAKLRELTDHMPTPDDEAVSAPKVPYPLAIKMGVYLFLMYFYFGGLNLSGDGDCKGHTESYFCKANSQANSD